jgi:hypothetical protein
MATNHPFGGVLARRYHGDIGVIVVLAGDTWSTLSGDKIVFLD